jgi:hypothetical protein
VVAAAAAQVVGHRVNDARGRLRAAGAVEKDGRLVADGAAEGRELGAQGVGVKGRDHWGVLLIGLDAIILDEWKLKNGVAACWRW